MNQHGDHSRRTGEVKLIADQAKTATNIDMSMMDYPEFSREDQRLTWFSISTMEKTTGNFDSENKIGEGGFGAVYKVKFHRTLDLLSSTRTYLSRILLTWFFRASCQMVKKLQ